MSTRSCLTMLPTANDRRHNCRPFIVSSLTEEECVSRQELTPHSERIAGNPESVVRRISTHEHALCTLLPDRRRIEN